MHRHVASTESDVTSVVAIYFVLPVHLSIHPSLCNRSHGCKESEGDRSHGSKERDRSHESEEDRSHGSKEGDRSHGSEEGKAIATAKSCSSKSSSSNSTSSTSSCKTCSKAIATAKS